MTLLSSDWQRACLASLVLLVLALLLVFKLHHGFEEGIGWYLVLLPGGILASLVTDSLLKGFPYGESVVFDVLLIGFNFSWYFVISYAVLKAFRSALKIKNRFFGPGDP